MHFIVGINILGVVLGVECAFPCKLSNSEEYPNVDGGYSAMQQQFPFDAYQALSSVVGWFFVNIGTLMNTMSSSALRTPIA